MGKRLGLIIGINQYQDSQWQPLQFAEQDARALAHWLVNAKGGKWSPPDVQHVQGIHATRELITSLISQVCTAIAEPGDLVLIYFAGQAFIDERTGDGYLACTNTRYQDPATSLHLPTLADQILSRSRAAHILFILDCAQIGSAWSVRQTTPYDFRPLLNSTLPALTQQQGNRLFLCSCRATEQDAEVSMHGLGLFMHQCIVGLCGPALDPASSTASLRQLHVFLAQVLDEQHKPHLLGHEIYPLTLTGELTTSTTSPATSSPATPPMAPTRNPFAASPASDSSYQQPATATATAQPAMLRDTSGIMSAAIAEQYRQQQYASLLEQAQQFLLAQNPTEALARVDQVLQLAPQQQGALTLKGQILGTMGRFQEALAVTEQIIQMDGNNALAWSMRAVLLANSGQPQAALKAIERSLMLDPGNAESYAIKTTIMAQQAMVQVQAQQQPLQQALSKATASRQRDKWRSFLAGLGIQLAGLSLGIVGSIILVLLPHMPAFLGLGLQSIGLALLCVNAAHGIYRHGLLRFILTLLTSLTAVALLVAALYRPLYIRMLAALKDHPSLLIPFLFVAIWLALTAALPFLAATGALLVRLIRRPQRI
jgi:tetratricopeptide (TPR) repeat protein